MHYIVDKVVIICRVVGEHNITLSVYELRKIIITGILISGKLSSNKQLSIDRYIETKTNQHVAIFIFKYFPFVIKFPGRLLVFVKNIRV